MKHNLKIMAVCLNLFFSLICFAAEPDGETAEWAELRGPGRVMFETASERETRHACYERTLLESNLDPRSMCEFPFPPDTRALFKHIDEREAAGQKRQKEKETKK